MGCFNTVVFATPCCALEIKEQSKSGDCSLQTFYSDKVKVSDLNGLSKYIYCTCGRKYKLKHKKYVKVKLILED